jgi:hypothetical protein
MAAGKPEGKKNIEDVAVERSKNIRIMTKYVIKCEAVEWVHVPGDS